MLVLTTGMDVRGVLRSLDRLGLESGALVRRAGTEALREEALVLAAASPVRTGRLAGSYQVLPTWDGAELVNATPYFPFVLLGTGRRGAASGVPARLRPPGYRYGPKAGMTANRRLVTALEAAPEHVALGTRARLSAGMALLARG